MLPVIRPPQNVVVLAVLEFEFLVSVLSFLLCIPEFCSTITKVMDKHLDVRDGEDVDVLRSPANQINRIKPFAVKKEKLLRSEMSW